MRPFVLFRQVPFGGVSPLNGTAAAALGRQEAPSRPPGPAGSAAGSPSCAAIPVIVPWTPFASEVMKKPAPASPGDQRVRSLFADHAKGEARRLNLPRAWRQLP
ncbi:hypothetical protein [Streptomyces sp.]|uniref:hypothetical protein n=1 Tax=Streptomyces sp. TaxID=1931 RepID=UPI002F4155C5